MVNSACKSKLIFHKTYTAYTVFTLNTKAHKIWKQKGAITNRKTAEIIIRIGGKDYFKKSTTKDKDRQLLMMKGSIYQV